MDDASCGGFVLAKTPFLREVLWMLADCAERQGDLVKAENLLRRLRETFAPGEDDQGLSSAIERVVELRYEEERRQQTLGAANESPLGTPSIGSGRSGKPRQANETALDNLVAFV